MQFVTSLVQRMKRDREASASPELAGFPIGTGLGTPCDESRHQSTAKRQKHCTPLSAEPLRAATAGLGFNHLPEGTLGDANPLFEAEEDNFDDMCQLQPWPDFPGLTPAPATSAGNDSRFASPGQCTVAAGGNARVSIAEFSTPPPRGCLLRALRAQLSSSLVLCALIRMQQRDLHPVGEGLDTIDYTLAGMLILCRRAGFGPEELSPQVLLTLLWLLESTGNQLRSPLRVCLRTYLHLTPRNSALESTLRTDMEAIQAQVLQRCRWRVLLRDADEVRQAKAELLADPTLGFTALCDYIEDAADGLAPAPSPAAPATLPPTASSGACAASGFRAAACPAAGATHHGWLPLVGAGLIPVLLRPWNLA